MIKAFFSHSSHDAELVRAVGREVGRPFTTIDYFAFQAGDEILSAIEQAIDESALFVLFASRPALQSLWVNVELDSARYRNALGRLKKFLVMVIDDSLRPTDFPSWMRRYNFTWSHAPRPLARIIRGAIDEVVRERQHPFFVGRARETAELQEAFAPTDGSPSARTIAVTGLTGIGRQTLVRRVARDLLTFPRLLRIDVESGDSIQDLAIKIADLTEPISSAEHFSRIFTQIEQSSDESACKRIQTDLRKAVELAELPMLYDQGGMLDRNGSLESAIRPIVRQVAAQDDLFLILVTNRRPSLESNGPVIGTSRTPIVSVRPLSEQEVRQLLALHARIADLTLSRAQINALAAEIRGYPPSVAYAVELMRTYGPDVVLADPARLKDFSARSFVRYLRAVVPGDGEKELLRILASNSPLPLPVLMEVTGHSADNLGSELMRLIDASLVMPDNAGWYRIAEPVLEAITREYSACTPEQYALVASALANFQQQIDNEDENHLELSRVRYRALVLSGKRSAANQAGVLVADWIRLAEYQYHQRDYRSSAEAARAAVTARPRNTDARIWLIKALIKQGEYDEADSEIDQLQQLGFHREGLYFRGFLLRNRSRFSEAARYYESALTAGYSGVAIRRELAVCYLNENDLERARTHIQWAQDRQPDNPYIVDLLIQIATKQRDEETARELLERLKEVDDPAFAAHRRSRVEYAFGFPEAAYESALTAVGDARRPPFEILANLALCQIVTGRSEEADESINRLSRIYPSRFPDIQKGLRCRAAIEKGEYEAALAIWEELEDKSKLVHLALRRDAIEGLLDATYVPGEQREKYLEELERLNDRLEGRIPDDLPAL